jgi:hypothetical protein
LEESFKSYFPGKNEVGPLHLTICLGNYVAKKSIPPVKFEIMGRPANIVVNVEELAEPLIGKSFPLKIEITNESRGDASNLVIELKMPEDESIDIVRGTLKKQFFNLLAGEATAWEIMLRPNEEGTFIITGSISFEDRDGRRIGPQHVEIPLTIKL